MEMLGKYLVVVAGIAGCVVVVIYGDPDKAEKWGSLATAAISAAVLWQQRQQGHVLEAQTRDQHQLTDKVEAVRQDVNNGAAQAIAQKAAEAYAAGIRDATRELKPVIDAVVSGTGSGG